MTLSNVLAPDEVGLPKLTIHDRCDRCGVDMYGKGIAQAYYKATFPTGFTLLFCAHHGRENKAMLESQNAVIIDDTRFMK